MEFNDEVFRIVEPFVLWGLPVVACIVFRHPALRILLCVAIGTPLLWMRMVWIQENAPDGDLDIIFMIALMIWSGVLLVYFSIVVAILTMLLNWIRRQRTSSSDGPVE